jgi:acyl transferase domain-containing protein
MSAEESIAIIGMAGRFPGAPSVRALWMGLCAGDEGITHFSVEDLIAAGMPSEMARDPAYVRARGVLSDDDCFDASLFGMGAREAELTDPQQRLWLECALAALEDAGYDPRREEGLVGVFAGSGSPDYLMRWRETGGSRDPLAAYQWIIGNDKDFLTTRVSYKLGLKGPSVAVQTACSTSLVAVYLAVQSLLSFQCDVAIAGGVSLSVPSRAGYFYRDGIILSPDGHCRPFDARAKGTVPGDGVGAVVLRRLADAEAQGDDIYAVIRGAAVNNDGNAKVGYSAPSSAGQVDVILQALAFAGIEAREVGFVEGHGTGTALGDPIEVAALTEVFRQGGAPVGRCLLGSVKSNLGHLNVAAGVTGLIKAALALRHRAIPPTLHFKRENPETRLGDSPFRVNRELVAWGADRPRYAGVSSFGIGGTNAHVVLGEAPPRPPRAATPRSRLLTVSAASRDALGRACRDLGAHLRHEGPPLAAVSDTLTTGRSERAFRRAIVAVSTEEAAERLDEEFDPAWAPSANEVAFLFPGQGSQYAGMGRALLDEEPRYRDVMLRCAAILRERAGIDLMGTLDGGDFIESTELAQPVLFAVEYALASVLLGWGMTPAAMLGHSLGEYVAACLAEVLSLEDALLLVAERGRLMRSTPPGAMLSVPLDEEATVRLLDGTVDLAAANAPTQCVVAGDPGAVAAFREKLRAAGIESRPLRPTHAFHSRLMDPILGTFERRCANVPLAAPTIPFLSCVTGELITAQQATDPAYWALQIRSTVRFDRALRQLFDERRVLVEVGPGDTLSAFARRHPARPAAETVATTMRRANESISDPAKLVAAVGDAWCAGVTVDYAAMRKAARQRAHLPTYPFDRARYWGLRGTGFSVQRTRGLTLSGKSIASSNQLGPLTRSSLAVDRRSLSVPSLGRPPTLHDRVIAPGPAGIPVPAGPPGWLYTTRWRPAPSRAAPSGSRERFIVLAAEGSAACALVGRLGAGAVLVTAGPRFERTAEGRFVVDPERRDDLEVVLAAVEGDVHVVSGLALDAPTSPESIDRALALGYFSAAALVQALGARRAGRASLTLLTAGATGAGGSVPQPALATLVGLLRALPAEYSALAASLIDLDRAELGRPEGLAALAGEILSTPRAPLVALRGADRLVPVHEHLPPAAAPEVPAIQPGGVYLITGGLGGIGITLANHLAKAHGARLALVSRRGLPPRETWPELLARSKSDARRRELEMFLELQASGAEVLLREADVADPEQARALVRDTLVRFGALDGVIHAAGVTGGGALQRRAREDSLAILRPKVHGTLALDAALRDVPIDFFVLCSSLTTIVGGYGQADYAAANAFLDAFAEGANVEGERLVVSVAWDGWREVGAAARYAQRTTTGHSPEGTSP